MKRTLLLAAVLGLSTDPAWSDWSDNFDSYALGSTLAGQGGWELWYLGGGDAYISNVHPASGTKCVVESAGSNVVRQIEEFTGRWEFKIAVYVPADAAGVAYVILMNQYGDPAIDSPSLRVRFDADLGVVASEPEEAQLPLIRSQWAYLQARFSLNDDTLEITYGGQPLSTGLIWSTHLDPFGVPALACIELYSFSMDDYFCDSASLAPKPWLVGDMNCDGSVNGFDIAPFVQCIVRGTPSGYCSDCSNGDSNNDGFVNAFDIDYFVQCVIHGG